jgi:hypothetical protein
MERRYGPAAVSAALAFTLAGCNGTTPPEHSVSWYQAADPTVTQAKLDDCERLAPIDRTIDCTNAYQGQAMREVYGLPRTVERHEMTRT